MDESNRGARVIGWVRANPLPTACLIGGLIVGPVYTQFAFPDVAPWRHVLGGLIAGVYFALCAIPHRFM